MIFAMQGSLQEQSDSESESSLSQSPNMQDWLAHAHSTRNQHQQDTLQRQRVHWSFCYDVIFSLELIK